MYNEVKKVKKKKVTHNCNFILCFIVLVVAILQEIERKDSCERLLDEIEGYINNPEDPFTKRIAQKHLRILPNKCMCGD